MESSHGREKGVEGSFSIWARVGVDWKERSKQEKENPNLVGATLLQQT